VNNVTGRLLALARIGLALGAAFVLGNSLLLAAPGYSVGEARAATLFGFNELPVASGYSLQTQLGAPVRRLFVPWIYVEPQQGTWNWGPFDAEYSQQLAAGLRPLIVAIAAPCWAALNRWCSASGEAPPAAAYDSDWTQYVQQLAARYPQAIGVEIWNEQNLTSSFEPMADPVRYTTLLKEAYSAVRSVSVSMPVISGGLFNSPGIGSLVSGPVGIGDQTFLAQMFANGAGRSMDAIGAHPYLWTGSATWSTQATVDSIDRLRAARDAAGAGSMPIWVTEAGESTVSEPGGLVGVSAQQQASDLTSVVQYFASQPDIPVALIDRLVDTTTGDPIESGLGIYTANLAPKPAACALSALWQGTLSCPFTVHPTTLTTPPPTASPASTATPVSTTSSSIQTTAAGNATLPNNTMIHRGTRWGSCTSLAARDRRKHAHRRAMAARKRCNLARAKARSRRRGYRVRK
jgi:hypothetical protein